MFRRLLGLAAVAATLAVVVPASPAQARACEELSYCTTTYYVDSSYTRVAGRWIDDCWGTEPYGWGTRTGWVRFVETPC